MGPWEKIVGGNVRRLRLERGLTQEQLGFETGLTMRHIGAIERGQTSATVGVLGKLAAVLGIEPGRLLSTD